MSHHNQFQHNDLCGLLCSHYSALEIWKRHLPNIIAASKHPDDSKFSHREWTEKILRHFTPMILESKALVSETGKIIHGDSMDRIVGILRQKINAHNLRENNESSIHRLKKKNGKTTGKSVESDQSTTIDTTQPLKIAVVGGSITEGNGCSIAPVHIPKGSIMSNSIYCAWPYRFEQFINNIAGFELIQVVNMAEDGTETALMTPLLRNWVYPASLLPDGPDIVINAYSTFDYINNEDNDSGKKSSNPSIPYDKINEEMESFIDAIEASHPCGHTPLVVHLFDTSRSNNKVSRSLNEKKGSTVISINYDDIVSKSATFDGIEHELKNDITFGMSGHMLMTWILAYSFIEILLNYCSTIASKAGDIPKGNHLKDLDKSHTIFSKSVDMNATNCKDASTGHDPCVFAWFAGPAGTVFKSYEIKKYITPFIVENYNWETNTDMSTGFSRKTGLIATAPGASIIFEAKDITKEVQYINFMVLKSNLPKWDGGVAKFTVTVNEKDVPVKELSFEIDSTTTKTNPITYPIEVDLKDYKAPVGSTLRFRVTLIEGQSFKILGMMFCS